LRKIFSSTGLLTVVCLVNLVFAATRFVVPADFGNDELSRHDRVLHQVRDALRSENPSSIGYIGDRPLTEWTPKDVETFYRTQYGLAPIVVHQNVGDAAFVVGRLSGPLLNEPQLSGFVLVHDFGEGVQLFRKRND
jgi:hypothetical protein